MPRSIKHTKTKVLYRGHFRLEQLTYAAERYTGGMPEAVTREVLRSGASVAVLLYDPAADSVVLTEQFRVGAYVNGVADPWLLECVAGMVDAGETPEIAARREAEEETGCIVGRMETIGHYLTSPGITDEMTTIFVGTVDARHAGGVHGEVSEGEDIMTRILPRAEAIAKAERGEVLDIVAQLALLWLSRHGDALRSRWLDAQIDVVAASSHYL